MDTLAMVKALKALGVIRGTFSIEGQLTSFEIQESPVTLPAPPFPEPDDLPATQDDITTAANRLMGRKIVP